MINNLFFSLGFAIWGWGQLLQRHWLKNSLGGVGQDVGMEIRETDASRDVEREGSGWEM